MALANKTARIAWVLMARQEVYTPAAGSRSAVTTRTDAVDPRVVRRDNEPAAAGDGRNPGGQSASRALT